MTTPSDTLAAKRAELARRRAGLTTEQQQQVADSSRTAVTSSQTIPVRNPGAPVPMSFAQELLWRLERASPGHAYNVPRAIRLGGVLDLPALQQALNALVARHEALRTTFALVDDEPRQVINAATPVAIERISVEHLASDHRVDGARAHMRELAIRTFDLEHDPQLRVALIRFDANDHVLQLVSHHIVSDGWTGNVIMRDLSRLYEGFRNGTEPSLPPLPIQYADYAVWQRSYLAGSRLDRLLAYWRAQLSGVPAQLDLPTIRDRPGTLGFEGASVGLTLPPSVIANLHALAREQGATSFMVVLATLYVLLARYSKESELAVGTTIAGRSHPELNDLVGYFANTLILRVSLGDNPTFRELLARVRTVTLGAHEHQDIPLETLLQVSGADGRPLVTMPQVVLSTEDPDRESLNLGNTTSTRVGTALGATKFDLQFTVAERTAGLQLGTEFRTALFDHATVQRMLHHFGVLLQSALASPDSRVNALPILSDDERRQVLEEWNDTQAGYPEHATVHGLIEQQVLKRPDAVALEFPMADATSRITYRELNERANRVAWALSRAGVAPDDRVALCLERTPDMVVAILGVLKAGGAYLPIDPAYPDDRIEFTTQDAGARIMIVDEANCTRLSALSHDARVVRVTELMESVSNAESVSGPVVNVTPDNSAYVIYTSGSTGRPKGVMVEHRNVTRLLVNDRSLFDFDEHDVWTVFHSFAFDFSVWELYGALMFGGRAVIVPRTVAQSPSDFLALLESTGTTVLNQVPSAFYGLMELAVAQKPTLRVRYLIFGGEALKPALLRPWRTAWPETRLINMFGITETTVHVTYKEMGDEEINAGVSNIGRPIPTLTMYVLDELLQPVPVGVTGEICVGGLGVARGYLNRPELSAERFVTDPFGRGKRLYRSGDLGRLMPSGEVEYLGRRDHQVKLRGHRIELGEIESALVQHPDVSEAVAMVREDSPGDQRLVTYIVANAFPPPDIGVLRDWLRQSLPEVMVPAAFMFLDRLPLTSNGKVDRKALPIPQGGLLKRAHQSPRSTIEHELVQIWGKLLSPGRPISALDDFFEIGGHSLLAIRMLAEIERVRGQRVPLAWLFESSTVEKLAARLATTLAPEKEPPLVVVQPQGKGLPIAFVHGDWSGGGWYVRRLAPLVAPDSPFYVLPTLGVESGANPWTIETMAARHISELRKMQPAGPYRVVGFCVGGIVAFEMARQLRAAGQVVEHLVVIDSTPMNARLRRVGPLLRLVPGINARQRLIRRAALLHRIRWAQGRIAYFNHLPKQSKSSWILDKVVRTLPRLVREATTANAVTATGAPPTAEVIDDGDRDAVLLEAQATASAAYLPGLFDGVIEFCWAQGAPGTAPRPNPVSRWKLLASEVRLTPIASGHIGLITNNLSLLANALRSALNREPGQR